VGGDLVEEPVPGHDRLHEQGLEALELIFECGKPEEFDDVHFLQTIGQDADGGENGSEYGCLRVWGVPVPVDFVFSY
jgi:hypothetical protein